MALEQQLAHRVFRDPAYPYISNTSPLTTDSYFALGSSDILTSIAGYAQRRPGFSDTVETTPTVFNDLQRLFTWDRNDGTFYVMACDINASNFAVVYKYAVGIDASFSSIFTEPTATGTPYDFVTSNDTLYFSNGFYVRKWDPVNGLSNWGIAGYNASGSTSAYAGTGTNVVFGGNAWASPGNITGAPDGVYTTATTTGGFPPRPNTDYLQATNYGFSVPAANTIQGLQVNIVAHVTSTPGGTPLVTAQLLVNGTAAGTVKTLPLTSTTDVTLSFGSTSDLWGTTLSPPNVNGSTFGVQIHGDSPRGTTFSIDSCQVVISNSGAPNVTFAGTGLTASTGYEYVICYGNSNTGHVSSPSVPSNLVKPTNQGMSIPLVASTDPQVNQIRVFRTTDSATGFGGQSYFELPTSPYPNIQWTFTSVANAAAGSTVYTGTFTGASGFASSVGQSFVVAGFTNAANNGTFPCTAATATTITLTNSGGVAEVHAATGNEVALDSATDTSLNIYAIAPTPTFNDPPPAMQGMVYFSGRIWGLTGNKVWFTGLEEITIGVPEECVPSGIAGNFWSFDQPVQSIGVAGSGSSQSLLIKCGGRLYGITGTTLDTFQRTTISRRRGSRSIASDTMIGGMNAWLDSANQIWATDGSSLEELSIPIRPDLTGITQSKCSMTFHTSSVAHWLVFSTGSKLYLYDIDTEQWMPPWNFAADYIYSGEISPGNYVLMASTGTKAVQLNLSKFNDQGATYRPEIVANLMSVVPDFGKRFSYIGQGMYDEPSRTGVPYYVEVDTNNASALSDVLVMQDDDPTTASYSSIFSSKVGADTAYNRSAAGTKIIQNIFPQNAPSCRWYGMKIVLENADSLDKVYGWFMAYKAVGGR